MPQVLAGQELEAASPAPVERRKEGRWLSARPSLRLALAGAALGLLCALFGSGLWALGAGEGLEKAARDALFRARGERQSDNRILVLLVDDSTIARAQRYPLPRRVYAEAIRRLSAQGAKTIALDVRFETPLDRDDGSLQRACRQSKRVIQEAVFGAPSVYLGAKALPPCFAVRDERSKPDSRAPSVSSPLPELVESAVALGHGNIAPEADGTFRRVSHVMRNADGTYPSLALATAAHALGLAPHDIVAHDSAIELQRDDEVLRSIPLDVQGRTPLNWTGGPRVYNVYPLQWLLDGAIGAGRVRDSIVLIGLARSGSYSPVSTPFSPLQAGSVLQTPILLQANALDDILSDRPLRVLPAVLAVVFALGLGALTGAGATSRGALGGVLWTLALATITWHASVFTLRANCLVPVAGWLIAVLVSGAAAIALRLDFEAREVRRVKTLFGGYVGQEVLRDLEGHRPRLDGELRPVTVLFCDIRGFTGISESLRDDPVRLLALLNEHFAPLVLSLKRHYAYVDNYLADMVIALFGAPLASSAPAIDTRLAVQAAFDLLRIVRENNEVRLQRGQTPIEVGIGVHCGMAVVGNLGAAQKMHYTALGDTVNVGRRIEEMTRVYETPFLVSEDVVRACTGPLQATAESEHAARRVNALASDDASHDNDLLEHAQWEFMAEAHVKGRREAVRLYCCTNLAELIGPNSLQ